MPTRYIKESAVTSPNLARLAHGAERLFWRLILRTDDFGRFDADPEVVRGGCLAKVPVTIEEVAAWLKEMVEADLIRLYRAGGRRLGYFITWEKHQGKPRAKDSKFAPPPTVVRIRKQLHADVGRRGREQADLGNRGHLRANGPVGRSSYSESKSSSSSGVNGPQPISDLIAREGERLKASAPGGRSV